MNSTRFLHLPLFGLAAAALVSGTFSGLARMGWWPGWLSGPTLMAHGSLMTVGFLGTLISLERAIASGKLTAYIIPLLAGLGGLAAWLEAPVQLGEGLSLLAGLLLTGLLISMTARHVTLHGITLALAAGLWGVGNLLWWLERPLDQVSLWWIAFLVLTIASERLELARVLRWPPAVKRLYAAAVLLLLSGLVLSLVAYAAGARLSGMGFLALALWMLRYDIAWRTVRLSGQPRFIAICLLSGYAWLVFSGVCWVIWGGAVSGGPLYGTLLHAIFLGFVFSMIFGHASIVATAVLGRPVPYHPLFYAHLLLLHLSLGLRVASNFALWIPGRQWGGLLNGIALAWFLCATLGALVWGQRQANRPLRPIPPA